jgi:hypothetical protein
MNCPHHHMIYLNRPRSYRELPLRLAEYGTCYRFEKSGQLAGLLRVRSLAMNDAHIYCTVDQVKEEFKKIVAMQQFYYKKFRLDKVWVRLSLHDQDKEKFVQNEELWSKTENTLREILRELNVEFEEAVGEAAFYGPKLDYFHRPTGLYRPRALRPGIRGHGRFPATAPRHSPLSVGNARKVHLLPDRKVRRGLPDLAFTHPGQDRAGGRGIPALRRKTIHGLA